MTCDDTAQEDTDTVHEGREQALERTIEQLRILNRIARHDIRNDMTVVLGWSQELESHVGPEAQPILDRIQNTSQHVIDLTKTVRDFVETLGTDSQATLKPIDVGAYLEKELTKCRSTYPDASFTVEATIPSVTVEANELLSSVFRNILNNAVQHNYKEDPRVEISIREGEETVTVRIADNGPGIPGGQKDAIFGRGEGGLDNPAAGIGLYLVDTLVCEYGGTVRVEDNQPEGSVFVVELKRT